MDKYNVRGRFTAINLKQNVNTNTSALIITGVLLLTKLSSSAHINDSVSAIDDNISGEGEYWLPAKEECCSIDEEFLCDSHKSPPIIDCGTDAYVTMLEPNKYSTDEFEVLNETLNENQQTSLLVLVKKNLSFKDYCLGWKVEGKMQFKAALICTPLHANNYSTHNKHGKASEDSIYTLYYICLILSSVFSLLTFIVYCILPWLRDLQGKVIMSLLISLAIGYAFLAFLQLYNVIISNTVCILGGLMAYYWLIAAFCWLHISCFNIWRTVALQSNRFIFFKNKTRLFILYCLFGWGIPLIFLLIFIIIDLINDKESSIGKTSCWFHTNSTDKWTFLYGPILLLIISNIFYFISVIRHVYKMEKLQSNPTNTENDETSNRNTMTNQTNFMKRTFNRCKLYLKLFFTMGITFIFEIISSLYLDTDSSTLRFLFTVMDLINSLQGVILFIVLILTRKRVLKSIFKKLNAPSKMMTLLNINENEDDYDDILVSESFELTRRSHQNQAVEQEIQMS
ncbi:putative G-protein coupled receptor Mth-like 10 [Lycorma delicatula]|uniref:putative G-protein coupled receptor Mth-like 10 n=1 Tax=Lycorma delicatula TaxID=130591 RepID=UPI003F50DF9D